MNKIKLISTLLIVLLGFGIFAAVPQVAAQNNTINFGYVQWPGVTVKTHVAAKIAEYLGYETEMTAASQAIIFKSLETEDLDVFLGNWLPTMQMHFNEYQEKGVVHNVRVNLEDVVYQTAVPEYVYEAGVQSLADLNEHAEKFDNKIYGIEPGNDGNIIIQEAIDNNTYNLGNWTLQASSTAGMLSSVQRAVNNKEWIAFNGWKPHYMNVMFDLKYLKDPEGIWGENDSVYTVARNGYQDENPNFYKFLEQFTVTAPIQNQWVDEYQNKDRDPEAVAEEWIANNLDVVNQWVFGVKSTDGRMGRKVIAEIVNN
ncbi:glycine betaine/proline transport system substrate-binding protein [Halanaerobium saccharolyticum]|uniref:Glycine betaine/proline transport system substrate-binding protein n=1 Tax=Halanaerobium saccharolyticum TaxID=43595 RepID=A0A4V3G4A2_9FIRM|nr:ABC transporter substrate-binding protein [Halanaerobium saccharolyticum]RAK05252.1 glycine betaine/proline transport system substrate-binding protein [Halanaerobium saccharolyticum]TDV99617.1 glycine betaine/proline transport system substrate-binding protein [Halanaerobium saccharolyticum]TDX51733.1 glycine betaine/proline transport system substrate-binding protein [Halanaerobium saccharolyticum]